MTPYEAVREEFEFPFELYPFQIKTLNQYSSDNPQELDWHYERIGLYDEAGAGKTATISHWMFHKSIVLGTRHWVLVMPPILIPQWARWLEKIRSRRTGLSPTVTQYTGTPAQRKALDLGANFVLMSYGLLKNDFDRIAGFYANRAMGVMCDEAHAVKNIASQTHKAVRDLAEGRPLALLTGTPLTSPGDAYAYIKLIAPTIYRNKRQFDNLHIGELDDYNKVVAWKNLELLTNNMKVQTSRTLRREVNLELPKLTYTPLVYDLDPAHLKLYNRIAQEKLVEFEDGREINAISAPALYSALQQIVINWGHFEDDDTKEPAALELIDEVFSEIGPDAKLAVVANFVRSNGYLLGKLQKYGAVALYGEVSTKVKQQAIQRFITDPGCRCIILQPQSAGFGVDGLQKVCSDMLILEAPTTAPPFHQVTARLDRDGQTSPVNCRIAIASKTVQVRMFKSLLNNDETINAIQGGYKDLKDAIYGD